MDSNFGYLLGLGINCCVHHERTYIGYLIYLKGEESKGKFKSDVKQSIHQQCGPLVSEATALPTEPQPQALKLNLFV